MTPISFDLSTVRTESKGSVKPVPTGSTRQELEGCFNGVTSPLTNNPSNLCLRIWYNSLIEFKDGKATLIRSYSVPASGSDLQTLKKKSVKKKPKNLSKVILEKEEVY